MPLPAMAGWIWILAEHSLSLGLMLYWLPAASAHCLWKEMRALLQHWAPGRGQGIQRLADLSDMSSHVQGGARWWHQIQQRKEGGTLAMLHSVHHDPAISQQHIPLSYHGIQLNYEAGVTELLSPKILPQGFQHTRDCFCSTGFLSLFFHFCGQIASKKI